MASNSTTRETALCYDAGRALMHLQLREGIAGAWEVEIVDLEQSRRVVQPFDDEASARRAAEIAYRRGERFGHWRVEKPGQHLAARSPSGPEPLHGPASVD
ncbi:hypothetical protein [Catellatospora methionotrophica]|uniref:hypothetical protein n=1 Tax=Catellatospora methionotrophica TaxID=121620 RepID=UPI0033E12D92